MGSNNNNSWIEAVCVFGICYYLVPILLHGPHISWAGLLLFGLLLFLIPPSCMVAPNGKIDNNTTSCFENCLTPLNIPCNSSQENSIMNANNFMWGCSAFHENSYPSTQGASNELGSSKLLVNYTERIEAESYIRHGSYHQDVSHSDPAIFVPTYG